MQPEVGLIDETGIKQPTQSDQSAHLKLSSQTQDLLRHRRAGLICRTQRLQWHQQFGRNLIAPALGLLLRYLARLAIRYACRPKPQVRQLVGHGEHLGCLAVCAIQEHQWCQLIRQRKAAKLTHIQFAMTVATNDATYHHHHTGIFHLGNQLTQRVGPGGKLTPLFDRELQLFAHALRHGLRRLRTMCAADKCQRGHPMHTGIIAVPVLSLLTQIERI